MLFEHVGSKLPTLRNLAQVAPNNARGYELFDVGAAAFHRFRAERGRNRSTAALIRVTHGAYSN